MSAVRNLYLAFGFMVITNDPLIFYTETGSKHVYKILNQPFFNPLRPSSYYTYHLL
jgi:hypothetical protein